MYDISKLDLATFVQAIDSPDRSKMAAATELYIAEKLRERGFARQIVTPRPVGRHDLINAKEHDQLIYRAEKEVATSAATILTNVSQPQAEQIRTERYDIAIDKYGSNIFEKEELELYASAQPVPKIIEENAIRECERREDVSWLALSDAAAVAAGNTINVSGTGGKLTPDAIFQLRNLIDGKELNCAKILMDRTTFNSLNLLPATQVGSPLASEMAVDGYKYYTWQGIQLIVSIKKTLLTKAGKPVVYAYADEKALGQFITFEPYKFLAKKDWTKIMFMVYGYLGMGIGNNNGVAYATLDA